MDETEGKLVGLATYVSKVHFVVSQAVGHPDDWSKYDHNLVDLAFRADCDIEQLRARLGRLITILTDSASQTDRASPVVNGVTPDGWLPPGEQWWESFVECVQRQIESADETKD